MQALDLANPPLTGIHLIEASAGTGKTYTLAALYLHLVLAQRQVEQILVVTFTQAATAELQGRIRERLAAALQAFTHAQPGPDALLASLLAQYAGSRRELAVLRLRYALHSFERAAIYTIHGFCQRVLQDFPLLTGHSPNLSLRKSERAAELMLVEDFWRREITPAHPLLVEHLLEQGLTPEKLLAALPEGLRSYTCQVLTVNDPPALEPLWQALLAQYRQARASWAGSGAVEALQQLVLQKDQLHGGRYKPEQVRKSHQAWTRHFRDPERPPSLGIPEDLARFGLSKLQNSVNKKAGPACHQVLQEPLWAILETLLIQQQQLQDALQQHYWHLLARLRAHALATLPRQRLEAQAFSYDDLPRNLSQALHGPDGVRLAARLRARYPAALVDEFQDTDAQQLQLLQAMHAPAGAAPATPTVMYLVGDPKQAIYRFRGADVYSYLKARRLAHSQRHLPANYRAGQTLLDGLNALYQAQPNPFVQPEIQYHAVAAGRRDPARLDCAGQPLAPWQIYWLERPEGQKSVHQELAQRHLLPAFATAIAHLLRAGEIIEAGQRRPVVGNDIAILVRSHRQAERVRTALEAQGIPCAQQGAANVLAAPEAAALTQWLSAVLEPTREEVLRGALAGPFYGLNAAALAALTPDSAAWEAYLGQFWTDHECWQQRGFMALFHAWLHREQIATRLLAQPGGERQLTNLLHLGELLHQAAQQENPGPHALLRWLQEQRQALAEGLPSEDESHELRLESDAHRVRILTVHKSKGLEFNIVLCPLLYEATRHPPQRSYHTPAPDYDPILDLRVEADLDAAALETQAEDARLLYVALTRARICCYLGFGVSQEPTALSRLLAPWLGVTDPKDLASLRDAPLSTGYQQQAQRQSPGAWAVQLIGPVTEIPAPASVPTHLTLPALAALAWQRPLYPSWWLTSFSALLDSEHMSGVRTPGQNPDPDLQDVRQFPRGRLTGRCWHGILERLDFARPADYRQDQVSQALALAGFAPGWAPAVTAMLGRLLDQPHPALGGATLSQLAPDAYLRELEFHFSGAHWHTAALSRLLTAHGYPELRLHPPGSAPWGLVHGFMDLVVRYRGRYYLGDYKSNDLGLAAGAYAPTQLARIIHEEGYTLQALLYTLALHRYLRRRLPDYHYEQHQGGLVFFFLRGLDNEHPHQGIYPLRPSLATIEALDAYFSPA